MWFTLLAHQSPIRARTLAVSPCYVRISEPHTTNSFAAVGLDKRRIGYNRLSPSYQEKVLPPTRTFRKIGSLFTEENSGWLELRNHAAKLAFLTRELRAVLPEALSNHLASVAMKPSAPRLVIFSDSAAWCTRLRYFAPALGHRAEEIVGHRIQLQFLTLAVDGRPSEQPPSQTFSADGEIEHLRQMLKD